MLGWTCVFLYVLLTLINAKSVLPDASLPVLFAGGACCWRRPRASRPLGWAAPAYAGALVLSGLLLAPLAMPVLPPATFRRATMAGH